MFLLAVGLGGAAAAQTQQCGMVNGVYTCTTPPNCGYVNTGQGLQYECIGGSGTSTSSSGQVAPAPVPTAPGGGLGWLDAFANWLVGALEWIVVWAFTIVLNAILAVVAALPVPGVISQFESYVGALPDGLVWWLGMLKFKEGLTMIGSATGFRFLMTWIPFAGPKA